ncbi:MAG: methyltransferase domain-containing protein, partial [Planctomycetes bacterium]|nr:methyltransferase domain-containing protein [Planctomycetota bacterium]
MSVVDLGLQPPANALLASLDDAATELRFPLELFRCRHCGLLQLLDVVDPEILFGHYLYLTGASSTMRTHFKDYARAVVRDAGLEHGARVCEIASNDGSLLQGFLDDGCSVLGIEPARNVAAIARERGIDTDCRFFDLAEAAKIRDQHGAFAVAVANNVLAHVDEPVGFLAGMRRLVEPQGWVVVEVPWAAEMYERLEYDTIYHEHLSCFLITPLLAIFERAGLSVRKLD